MADDLPDWAKSSGPEEKLPDWATSPAPQEKSGFPARSFSSDIKDFGYGAATSTLGIPGELESLGLKAGQWAGLAPKDEKPLLPDIAGVQSAADKYLGIGPRTGGMVTAGEYAPAAVALAPAGGKLVSALAAPVERALKPVGELASKIGTGVSDIAKNLNPRTAIEKIGKPSTISELGGKIHTKITDALKALTKSRAKEANNLFDTYKAAGKPHEDKILADYQKELTNWRAKLLSEGSLSPEEDTAVQKSFLKTAGFDPEIDTAQKDAAAAREAERQAAVATQGRRIPPRDLPKPPPKTAKVEPGIGALEKERRVLNDKANGMEVVGAEGISARAAKEISDLLTESIRKYVPDEFDAAMEGYKKASEPVNRYATALGSKITKTAHEYLPDMPKTDPAQVPGAFFKTKRGAQELKALSGDAKFAEQAAKEHVANELSGAKSSEDIERFLQNKNNKDWLTEFPKLRTQLEDAAKTLKKTERTKTVAKVGAGLLGVGAADATVRRILGGF
jgi:hypothetical protein